MKRPNLKLRDKLLLAQLPLVIALVVSAVVVAWSLRALGDSSEHILKENYRSVLAAQRMIDALERIDSDVVLSLVTHDVTDLQRTSEQRLRFSNELAVQQANISEPGERDATDTLARAWMAYTAQLDVFARAPYGTGGSDEDARVRTYRGSLESSFDVVKADAEHVLEINQDAMVHKSENAQRVGERVSQVSLLIIAAGLLLGLLGSGSLVARIVRPVTVLGLAARRFGEGDLDVRARVRGGDELAGLALEFNTMAERVQQYRKSSLGELLEAQRAAQAAIDSLPDPVLVVGLDHQPRLINRAAETLLHLSVDDIDPLRRADPIVRDAIARARDHVLSGKGALLPRSFDEAERLPTAEGERPFLPRAMPVYADDGEVAGATVVLQDVGRLVRMDELKNDLVATVAHEVRTPLTSLRMGIHLVLEEAAGPVTEKQADLLTAAREDCERLQTIVDELLDLSRIQSGRLDLLRARVSIDELVHAAIDATRAAAAERDVELRAELLPGLADVDVDRERAELVLGNLVGNAVRHTPAHAPVVVRVLDEEHVLRIEVLDHGPGVPPDEQALIFEKHAQLETGKKGSAGLGLFIVKEIVEAHGGTVGVQSDGVHGSTFWFTLPKFVDVEPTS